MAATFTRKTLAVTNTSGTLYTVPASTKAIVIGFVLSNTTSGIIKATIDCAGSNLITNVNISPETSLSVLDGKLVLEAADTVTIVSDTATCGDAILSVMEIV